MSYTIKITNTESRLAKSLLFYLRSLTDSQEYEFLQVIEDDTSLSDEMKKELDKRYEHFLQHSENYKDWDEIKQKYLPNEN